MAKGLTYWRYRRPFAIDGHAGMVVLRSRSDGLTSELLLDGKVVERDHTLPAGPEAVRNHRLESELPDGSHLMVEAGWISAFSTGIAVHRNDVLIHESHPGRTIAFPEKYREQTIAMDGETVGAMLRESVKQGSAEADKALADDNYDFDALKRNRIPLGVDIALGLLFFVVAKFTDLTTAALIGAAMGLALLVAQRLTKVDLLGGLALFGIALLLVSAGLAVMFQSDEAVKYRTTVIGLTSAILFFADRLAGGQRLAIRLKRYLPYGDIDPARLGIGMGLLGMIMAAANQAVAMWTSTDFWLFYSTFADFGLTMVLILLVFRYARGRMLAELHPRYRRDMPE